MFWGGGPEDYFHLPPGANTSIDVFKIIISTERTDDFQFAMDELDLQQGAHRAIPGLNRSSKVKGGWFTAAFRIKNVAEMKSNQ